MQAAENLGVSLANKMIEAGAGEIVRQAKETIAKEILMQKAEKEARLKALSSGDKKTEHSEGDEGNRLQNGDEGQVATSEISTA